MLLLDKNVVIFSLGKFEAAVGRQKPQITQFASFQSMGFFLLNLRYENE